MGEIKDNYIFTVSGDTPKGTLTTVEVNVLINYLEQSLSLFAYIYYNRQERNEIYFAIILWRNQAMRTY